MKTEIIISETPTIKDFEQRIDDDSLDSTHYSIGTGNKALNEALISLDVRFHGTVIIQDITKCRYGWRKMDTVKHINFYYCSYFSAGYLEGDIEYPFPKGDPVQKYMWKLAKWAIVDHAIKMIPGWNHKPNINLLWQKEE